MDGIQDILFVLIKILLLPLFIFVITIKYIIKALKDIFESSYKFLISENK
jgi:hypothetical protein